MQKMDTVSSVREDKGQENIHGQMFSLTNLGEQHLQF